ncbi:MAG TPA: hypothetical protein VF491_13260 [Vicinamibacterales bacterium]
MHVTRRGLLLSLIAFFAFGVQGQLIWQTSASRAIAISADAQLMLSGMQVRNAGSGTLVRTFVTGYSCSNVNAVAFSPDSKLAAIGIQSFNRNLFLFRVSDGTRLAGPLSPHSNGVTCLAFSPSGQLLASGGMDGTVKLWHLPDMTLLRTLNGGVGYRPRVFATLFSKDGATIALAGQGGVMQYRVADGQFLRQLTTVSTLSLALSANGVVLASGSDRIDQYGQCIDCSIKIWRMSDGLAWGTIPGNNNGVRALAFSPDQTKLAAGSGDREYNGSVRFYSMTTGQLLTEWRQDPNNPSSYVTAVAFAPFGRLFAYARQDAQVIARFAP